MSRQQYKLQQCGGTCGCYTERILNKILRSGAPRTPCCTAHFYAAGPWLSPVRQNITLQAFNNPFAHYQPTFIYPWQYTNITRKLIYRKDDRAMRPIYGCPTNFRESLSTPTATFPEIFNRLLFQSILWMCVGLENLKCGTLLHSGSIWDNQL